LAKIQVFVRHLRFESDKLKTILFRYGVLMPPFRISRPWKVLEIGLVLEILVKGLGIF